MNPSAQKGNILVPTLLILFILSIIYAAYYLGSYRNEGNLGSNNYIPSFTPTPFIAKCSEYGTVNNKDLLYPKYTVKRGDTLSSIAKNQLSDISRVGDIVYLNRDLYPGLSIQNPYIEQGWVFYLPPSFLKQVEVEGDRTLFLYQARGELIQIGPDWMIALDERSTRYGLRVEPDTQFIGKDKSEYRIGDCIKATMTSYNSKVNTISPQ